MVSNFDNMGHREMREAVVGFKPLMHFCFDRLAAEDGGGDDQPESVAVTCPRVPLKKERQIHKCCPPGKTFNFSSMAVTNRSYSRLHVHGWYLEVLLPPHQPQPPMVPPHQRAPLQREGVVPGRCPHICAIKGDGRE